MDAVSLVVTVVVVVGRDYFRFSDWPERIREPESTLCCCGCWGLVSVIFCSSFFCLIILSDYFICENIFINPKLMRIAAETYCTHNIFNCKNDMEQTRNVVMSMMEIVDGQTQGKVIIIGLLLMDQLDKFSPDRQTVMEHPLLKTTHEVLKLSSLHLDGIALGTT